MSKVITFSRSFQKKHPRAGEPTNFVEKIVKGFEILGIPIEDIDELAIDSLFPLDEDVYNQCAPKWHTIRSGNRFKVGDKFSPRVWGGRPYCSKQVILSEDVEVKKVWNFEMNADGEFFINGKPIDVTSSIWDGRTLSDIDGLDCDDFLNWFPVGKTFKGQIICWNENVKYYE